MRKRTSVIVGIALSVGVSSASAATACKVRKNPAKQNEYIQELGGLQQVQWDSSTGRAKGIFRSIYNKNGQMLIGPQELFGQVQSSATKQRNDTNIFFVMPDGATFLFRAFDADVKNVMHAFAAKIGSNLDGTPLLDSSFGQEYIDCMNVDF